MELRSNSMGSLRIDLVQKSSFKVGRAFDVVVICLNCERNKWVYIVVESPSKDLIYFRDPILVPNASAEP
jgi:hypothetical protein